MVPNINPVLDFISLCSLYRLLRARRYHIVHTHLAKAGMIGRWAAKLAGVPIIVHGLHGTTFHPKQNRHIRRFFIGLENLTAKFTDCFVCVGKSLRDLYLSQQIGRPESYVVIRSGMDLNAFFAAGKWSNSRVVKKKKELGINPRHPVIGYVASLEPRKGHTFAIKAIDSIASEHPNVVGMFVGEGFYRSKLEQLVNACGLGERIIFTGYRDDIAEVMATFDIKIFTSQWEGLPQVLVQSAAMGKPIVAFDVEGVREVVEDCVNGYVVPLGDSNALAAKVSHFLDDLTRAKEMGWQGRRLIDDSWSIATMTQRTRELYDQLVEDKYEQLAL
jgi:glycosyltransferase involved in cell wall biosynthesis